MHYPRPLSVAPTITADTLPSKASRLLRCTRLAELTLSTDPRLVSAAFGIHPQAATHYLADYVDDGRLHGTGPDGTGGH